MGDTKSKKTISKLGRLFGMLHADLTLLPEAAKSDSRSDAASDVKLDVRPDTKPAKSAKNAKVAKADAAKADAAKADAAKADAAKTDAAKTDAAKTDAAKADAAKTDAAKTDAAKTDAVKTDAAKTDAAKAEAAKNVLAPTARAPPPDEDVLYPLPHETLRAASPFAPTPFAAASAVSPPHSVLSLDLLPAALHLSLPPALADGVGVRSLPVSRLLSVNGAARKATLSRSLSGKRNGSALSPSVSSTHLATAAKPRFKMFEDGSHEHNLRAAKRQEKLSNMLKDLLGAKKLRDEAKSAVPNILQPAADKDGAQPPTLFAGLVSQVKNNTSPYDTLGAALLNPMSDQDCRSFAEKYGRCQEVIGRGSFGVVRISHKKSDTHVGLDEVLYAVKEFKRRPNESEQKYLRRLTSEFCILSSLKHTNIIDTLDLLKDAKGDYCEVMQFCSGGDLYTLIIAAGKLEYAEADCFFKQLIRGVTYMHEMGVAHRDLKPENLLLTQQGVLKITDFGNGECFKMAWENEIQLSEGVSGSSPYIAPEEFVQKEFDPRCVDIWACGVIYMAMRTGRQLWKLADPKRDEFFEEYLLKRKDATGYEPIESLKRARCRNVIYSILDPIPERRINGKQILNSEWGREIKVCAAGGSAASGASSSAGASTSDLGPVVSAEKLPATA